MDNKLYSVNTELTLDSDVSLSSSNYINLCENNVVLEESNFDIVHLNVRSLSSKLTELHLLLKHLNDLNCFPTVIMLNETYLTNTNTAICQLAGYNLFTKNRKNRKGGGVAMYILDNLSVTAVPELEFDVDNTIESLCLEVKVSSKRIILCSTYRVPNTSESIFTDKCSEFMKKVNAQNIHCVIGTDQNIDLLKSDSKLKSYEFLDSVLNNNFLPLITKPTRITNTSATLIDNIYVSRKLSECSSSSIIIEDISDHLPCLALLNLVGRRQRKPIEICTRNLKTDNLVRIANDLKNTKDICCEYQGVECDVNTLVDKLYTKINKSLD